MSRIVRMMVALGLLGSLITLVVQPVAAAAQPGMSTFEVRFERIDVLKDGDGWVDGKGEIYYRLAVDGEDVVLVPRNLHKSASDGDTIWINKSYFVTLPAQSGSYFSVSGSVAEADGKLTFEDDKAGDFDAVHAFDGGWRTGTKVVPLVGSGIAVLVRYRVIQLS